MERLGKTYVWAEAEATRKRRPKASRERLHVMSSVCCLKRVVLRAARQFSEEVLPQASFHQWKSDKQSLSATCRESGLNGERFYMC